MSKQDAVSSTETPNTHTLEGEQKWQTPTNYDTQFTTMQNQVLWKNSIMTMKFGTTGNLIHKHKANALSHNDQKCQRTNKF